MTDRYDPTATEAKWQKKWDAAKAHEIDFKKAKDPYYSLVMFPYPSGDKLHVGHWYNFGPADSHSRFMRMHGRDVLAPMGFDAFGLPAENYAIKTGIHPAESTAKNVQAMIGQLKRIGCMYDWSKMVNTSDPSYYYWTQWLFLQMFKHGLAYKKLAAVNWCVSCKTVLANEQVHDGKCERCGTEIIQRPLHQWFWGITKYADRLLEGLEKIDWPEKTKLMQRNWIGRSEGTEIEFAIAGHDEKITVFTTRPDTLFGATYLVLAPEHSLVEKITDAKHGGSVEAYRREVAKKTEMQRTDVTREKTGVPTGACALHPVTGEKIPIWTADYVLAHYGSGAIMAVPAHDERDYEFAKKFALPIEEVVGPPPSSVGAKPASAPERGTGKYFAHAGEGAFIDDGIAIHSKFLDGLPTHEAKKKMIAWLEDEDKGRLKVTYRLRDWLVSRQRYWGAPIPVVYDPSGRAHPIPREHLPWLLPKDVEFKPTGESPLRLSKEFIARTEKIFGEGWTPEFDTMDTFVCSSFYYLRYLAVSDERSAMSKSTSLKAQSSKRKAPHDQSKQLEHLVEPEIERRWMPVDMYIGGPEHATMHLIYARFVMMALKDFGIVSHDEPFQKLVHQGLITNRGAKMSKSRDNVVSPDSFVDRHGSDVLRMYLMFMGPFTEGGDWRDTGINGIERFVQRSWKVYGVNKKVDQDSDDVRSVLHATIKKVTDDITKLEFNTAISALMEFLNLAESQPAASKETAQTIAKLLAPLAPHLAEELWEVNGGTGFVMDQSWPQYDPKLLVRDRMTIVVQVNGKVRATMEIAAETQQKSIIESARKQENVVKFLEGKQSKKEIYVKGRLVNFVV